MKPILDADGIEICVGDILKHIVDNDRGVVVRIVKKGDKGTPMDSIGDINIATSPSTTRCTNNYHQWRRVPEAEQTHTERYQSWWHGQSSYDPEYCHTSKDEHDAVKGILALLPPDTIDYNYYNPSTTSEALYHLAQYIDSLHNTELANLIPKLRQALAK